MAKMRVHELAKELNIKSQDILDKLKNTKFDGKSASSNMEEEAQALVRGAFSKEAKPAADVKKTEVAKAGATKTADGKERPKKKSSITAVFNAQYSKQSRKPANGNNNNRGNGNGNGNNRRREDNKRPAQHSIIRPRPVGERAMRPISERTPSPTADLEVSKPANNKPAENTNTRNSQENRGNNNHSGGERNNRPQNDRNNDRGGVIREIETITIVRTETETTAVHRTTETITAGRTVSVKSRQQLQHRKKSAERTPVEIMTAAITTIIIGKIMINSAERNRKIM